MDARDFEVASQTSIEACLLPVGWAVSVMSDASATVIVVDDDPSVRRGLGNLFCSIDLNVATFGSVAEFLSARRPDGPVCLVLDVRLPGRSGLDLQAELADREEPLPIVFITGHGDVPMSVQAIKGGAIEFLVKPFREQSLLDAVQAGLERDRARLIQQTRQAEMRSRLASLTAREREVMGLVLAGEKNRDIARRLAIAEVTVKVHRAQLMRKLDAGSLLDLVRRVEQAGGAFRLNR